jgi:uncharacterized YigZ family protein
MLTEDFLTLVEPGTAATRVLGSRFSAYVCPVETESEFESVLAEMRKTHFDATHNCWAFIVRAGDELIERQSDDGEPKGTAGIPILQEIKKNELQNCGVIVTRWFGGTKLGTGGLVRAYGECAAMALVATPTKKYRTGVMLEIESNYDLQSIVYQLAGKFSAPVEFSATGDGTRLCVKLRRNQVDDFKAALTEHSAGKLTAHPGGSWIS